MEAPEELAARLMKGLAELPRRDKAQRANTAALAATAKALNEQISALPHELRQLLLTADSGFAAKGDWVSDAIDKQTELVNKLARATSMVASWHGTDGDVHERTFVIRGNIRGWAHRWRTTDRGTAQVDTDPDFVAFATACLKAADIHGDYPAILTAALAPDWRTAVARPPEDC